MAEAEAPADAAAAIAEPFVLPPYQETFIAQYSRNFKLGVVTFALALMVLPWALGRLIPPSVEAPKKIAEIHKTHVDGADTEAADTTTKPLHDRTSVSTSANAAVLNDQDDKNIKLTPAPDPSVTEDTPQGTLPRIAEDGRMPWQVYARPYNMADQRPRLAILVADLGLSRATSDAAINRLPTNVTLAFDVQSPVAAAWSSRARQDGHEVFISIPMEPFDYPRSDPGPNTLLTSLPSSDIIQRTIWALRQSVGYVGITTFSGSRLTTDPEKMSVVFDVLKQRGLMIFVARSAPHSVVYAMARDGIIPVATHNVPIDETMTPDAIDKALDRLEKEAQRHGRAVGVVSSTPLTLDHLERWLKDLPGRGVSLAPLSAMVE